MSTNRPMRRKDREITDIVAITEIIDRMDVIRVGFYDGKEVYIVPLSFGYEQKDGRFTFYMHGAKVGRKADLVRQQGKAGFELDCAVELVTAAEPCNHSVLFNSIIGHGTIEEISDADGKIAGLKAIMKHNTGKEDWTFPEKMLAATFVMKLTSDWLTCKVHE